MITLKKISRCSIAISIVVACWMLPCPLQAQSAAPISDSARAAAQRRMMRWVMPGDEHKFLARFAGQWNVTVTFPGSKPGESESLEGVGNAVLKLGDRFLAIESSVASPSHSMETFVILGFDGRRERYTYVGFDTFGTYYVTAEGELDTRTSKLTMTGYDKESETRTKHFDVIVRFESDDEFTQEIVFRQKEGDFVVLRARYKRA
jgi:hypothetical protein